MSQEGFQVVSELYKLLATFDAKAIEVASKKGGISTNLRDALVALHREAAAIDANGENRRQSKDVSKKSNAVQLSLTADSANEALFHMLMDQSNFPTKQSLAELAKRLNLDCQFARRDSRERAVKKIVRETAKSKTARDKLVKMLSSPKVSQTEGWLDLIQGDN